MMEKKKNKEIPLSVVMDQARTELVKKVNETSTKYHLPFYLLEILINEIHQEIYNNILAEKASYNESINNENEKESGD